MDGVVARARQSPGRNNPDFDRDDSIDGLRSPEALMLKTVGKIETPKTAATLALEAAHDHLKATSADPHSNIVDRVNAIELATLALVRIALEER